jgi:hypothetical protein
MSVKGKTIYDDEKLVVSGIYILIGFAINISLT